MSGPGCVWFYLAPPPRPARLPRPALLSRWRRLFSACGIPRPSPGRLVTAARCRCCSQSYGERDPGRRAELMSDNELRQTTPAPSWVLIFRSWQTKHFISWSQKYIMLVWLAVKTKLTWSAHRAFQTRRESRTDIVCIKWSVVVIFQLNQICAVMWTLLLAIIVKLSVGAIEQSFQ